MRGSIHNQVMQVWKILDGIRQSKYKSKKDSNYKSQNSQNISKKVHSFRYKDETIRTSLDLGNFAKKIFGISDMQQISDHIILAFFTNKIENECLYGTISTYISHVEKLHLALSNMDKKIKKHNELFTRKSLINARKNAKEFAISPKKRNRAYKNPKQIISLLPKKYLLIARLQFEYGLRVVEASKIKLSQLNEQENSFTFVGKGGYTLTKFLKNNLFLELKNLIIDYIKNDKIGLLISYSNYANQLKIAVDTCGEKWNSTHGLRYNYAQNRYQFYIDSGKTEEEALISTSEDMGHHRGEITGRYLSA